MTGMEIIRLSLGALLLLGGLFALLSAVIGNFRFRDVLPRMHAAGVADTLGVFLLFSGLTVLLGVSAFTLKLAVVLVLLWIASPTLSHLIMKVEIRMGAADEMAPSGERKDT